MKLIVSHIEAIIQLETRQLANPSPLFLTWSIKKFGKKFYSEKYLEVEILYVLWSS